METKNWLNVEATTVPHTGAIVEGTFGGIHAVNLDQHTSSLRPTRPGLSVDSHILHLKIPLSASAGKYVIIPPAFR
jgi:hypothetical protein